YLQLCYTNFHIMVKEFSKKPAQSDLPYDIWLFPPSRLIQMLHTASRFNQTLTYLVCCVKLLASCYDCSILTSHFFQLSICYRLQFIYREERLMNQFEKSDAVNRLPEQFFAQLAHTIQSHSQQGHDVIDLGRGNPDTKTPDYIVKALQEAAEEPINHKYAPFRGFSYL